MAIAININNIMEGLDEVIVFGTLTLSGSYATGGDTFDWTTIAGNASKNGRVFTPQALPDYVVVQGTTGDDYGYVAGTALNNGKLEINTASNTQLGAGAYNARFTGDANIFFQAAFPKLL